MKPVLMIHEIQESYLDLPLEEYVLTFDDGLYTQYKYWDYLKQLKTEKIFFISSGIVCIENQTTEFVGCVTAHKKAQEGNYENYMTVEQIQELQSDPLTVIGGHSHSHVRLNTFSSLFERVGYIVQDTEQMIKWFEQTLAQFPSHFCFPYNEDMDGLYSALLKKQGITHLYGSERIPIERLLHKDIPLDSPYTLQV